MINRIKQLFRKNILLSKLYVKLHLLKTKWIEKKVLNELKRIENLSKKELSKLQEVKLLNLLNYAYNNTTYYKKLFDDNNINLNSLKDLKQIPLLDKEIIRNNTQNLISNKYPIESLGKRSTGGSTGEPLEFYCNTEAGLQDYGHHTYLYSLMDYKKNDLILSCGGFKISDELIKNNVYWIKENKGNKFGDYRFSVLYLTEENISIYVNKMIELRPAILRGYPSFFDTIANFILSNNIVLDFAIKGINLTAEMCSEPQRIRIEEAFSTMIYFEYGHKEISIYCYTNDKSYIYKSSPIYGYVEVLNDDGRETKIGSVGNIITTGFNNLGMPFIRYKTGDLGEISYRNGGIVKFNKIHGRSQEYLIDNTGKKIYIVATIYGNKLKAFRRFKQWQIVQKKKGIAEILIIKKPEFSLIDEQEILASFQYFKNMSFSIKYVHEIAKTKIGKSKFLLQLIKA